MRRCRERGTVAGELCVGHLGLIGCSMMLIRVTSLPKQCVVVEEAKHPREPPPPPLSLPLASLLPLDGMQIGRNSAHLPVRLPALPLRSHQDALPFHSAMLIRFRPSRSSQLRR